MAAISGSKKAAMLLMCLDPNSAADLLSVVKPETVTEIATEIAYLNATSEEDDEDLNLASHNIIKEFSTLVEGSESDWGLGFVKQMLDNAMGQDKSSQAFEEVKQRLDLRDPFVGLRGVKLTELAAALEGEPAQVISLVLAELPAKAGAELLGMFEDSLSNEVIRGMAGATNVTAAAKVRVASVIKQRLQEIRVTGGAGEANAREAQIRKVSVLLRGLEKDIRDQMISQIREQDAETCDLVMKMMVIWEDLPIVEERALQEVLRGQDPRKLALAMTNVEQRVSDRIKMNLSETGRNMVYEESLLLTSPKPKEVTEARELILTDLRELNEAGMLEFEQE
jgi:flagellar motor switch protein FliG